MQRRQFIKAVGTVAAGTALAGCSDGASDEAGMLATAVSDQPGDINDFETLLIAINGIRVKPADGELEEYDAEGEVDLTQLVGEESELVDEQELSTGEYEYLQLEAEATEATLSDGSSATVELPGDAPLKFEQSFEIRADETTTFIADFTPVRQGQSGSYTLQPVASEVQVIYEDESSGNETGSGSGNTSG